MARNPVSSPRSSQRRPVTTLLHLGATRSLRLDLTGRGERRMQVFERGDEDLEALLAMGVPGRRCWILCESLWTQTLSLPLEAIRRLRPAELERAIAYELEPESGLPAAETLIGVRHVTSSPAQATFQVVCCDRTRYAAWMQRLRGLGSQLAGVASPCALVPELESDCAGLEVWPQVTVFRKGDVLQVVPARVGQRYWVQVITEHVTRFALDQLEVRGSLDIKDLDASLGAVLDPRGDLLLREDPEAWSKRALDALGSNARGIPRITPAARRVPSVRPSLIGCILALVVTAVAAFDYRELSTRVETLEQEVESVETERALVAQRSDKRTSMAQEVDSLQEELLSSQMRLTTLSQLLEEERRAVHALLEKLATEKPSGLHVRSIVERIRGAVEVEGVAVSSTVVGRFAADLAPLLARIGWKVAPAHAEERRAAGGARYYEFRIRVEPRGAGDVATTVMVEAKR